jgi:hypothetical protein
MAVKLQIIMVFLLMGLVGFAAPAAAQKGSRGGAGGGYGPLGVPSTGTDTAGDKYKDYLYGVVKDVNQEALVLTKTKAGTDLTFKFNKKTKFIRDGKDVSFELIKVGDQVWVDSDQDKKTAALIARKVVTGVVPAASY